MRTVEHIHLVVWFLGYTEVGRAGFYQITRAFSQLMFVGNPALLAFSGKIHRAFYNFKLKPRNPA